MPDQPRRKQVIPRHILAVLVAIVLTSTACVQYLGLLAFVGVQSQENIPTLDFTLKTLDGEFISGTDYPGKIVVVNFWASWCTPCRDEIPGLQAVWETYQDQNVVVIGIAYVDAESKAREFVEEYGLTYPIGLDAGSVIADSYGITGVPETFIFDQTGTLTETYLGPVQESQLTQIIESLLQNG